MQFCLLYIDKNTARLSCFEFLFSKTTNLTEARDSLNLIWTDISSSLVEDEAETESEISKVNSNYLLELLSRNTARLTDPLLVVFGISMVETYILNFPFSDIKKIKQVLNLELEEILPFDPDFSNTFIATQVLSSKSGAGCSVKSLLIDKSFFQNVTGDIQATGSIAPLFMYQPLVTEKLLKTGMNYRSESQVVLEYDNVNSYLFYSDPLNNVIEERSIILPSDLTALKEVLYAHLSIDDQTDIKKFIIINKSDSDLSGKLDFGKNKEIVYIDPSSFISNIDLNEISPDSHLISSTLCALAIGNELLGKDVLDDSNIKSLDFFNLREGEFKYRAPFSDFKENLFMEIVPFSLTGIFLLMLLVLNFSTPIKEISILERESLKLLLEQAPELSSSKGKPLDILSNEIINLENQIGGLTTMRSLSPFDWLYKLSKGLKDDIPVVLESLSITSTGIVFRGTVPNYPTSGKLDSMLKAMMKANSNIICKGEVNSEQGSSGQKISVTGVLELCQ